MKHVCIEGMLLQEEEVISYFNRDPFERAVAGGGGGGSGSGGGGSSGAVDFPAYMKTRHEGWLNAVDSRISTAISNNPYIGKSAYNPDTQLSNIGTALTYYKDLVDGYNPLTQYYSIVNNVVGTLYYSDKLLSDSVAEAVDIIIKPEVHTTPLFEAYSNFVDKEFSTKYIPSFEAGMRDINAVNSSAFVIGKALLMKEKSDRVEKFTSELNMALYNKRSDIISNFILKELDVVNTGTQLMTNSILQGMEFKRVYTALAYDVARMNIAAKSDQVAENRSIDVALAKWPLEAYQYGANMLAAISGGTVTSHRGDQTSQFAKTAGATLSGAASGAMIGTAFPPYGPGVGAVIGGTLGFISSFQ